MTTKVIQADREAAAKLADWFGTELGIDGNDLAAILNGAWDDEIDDLGAIVTAFASHADPLRRALEKIAEGDEPRPVGKSWFPDKRVSKHDQCTHGVWMYETCGNCIADFALAALSSGENNNGE